MKRVFHLPLVALVITMAFSLTSCTPEPIAGFTADKTTITEGETVQYTDLSSNDPTVWLWEFPGGTPSISQLQNPIVTYNNEGTYSVALEVRNKGGGNIMSIDNYITVEPAATDLTFINTTYTDIEIEVNGISKTIEQDGSVTYYNLEGESVVYDAYTWATTAQGNQIGWDLYWSNRTVDLEGGEQDLELYIGSAFFFLFITNNGTRTIGPIEVDQPEGEMLTANVGLPNDGAKYRLGYYEAWDDTQVRAYWDDQPDSWTYWDANVHFTYPDEINQEVELTNEFKKSTGTDPGRVVSSTGLDKLLPATGARPSPSIKEGVTRHYATRKK
jgi:PKD repeat protein